MEIALTPESEAFVRQQIASGKSADEIVNKAIEFFLAAQQRIAWLEAELEKGEQSGEPLPYTLGLLDRAEQAAISEIEAGNTEIDESVWPVSA
ncbi:MAG: type II toxin-antitoxin system ParD family antitoxin [Cyanobacteria bacterium P01_F01_bin.4]